MDEASLEKKKFSWSGQDVLCDSLNIDMSCFVTDQLNEVHSSLHYTKKAVKEAKKSMQYIKVLLKKFVMIIDTLVSICVLGNTIVMALDDYDNKKATDEWFDFFKQIFIRIFIAEMCLKLLVIGPKNYLSNPINLLDCICVILSIIGIIISDVANSEVTGLL